MPPYGLYTMARNHLYGGRMKRPIYNTNDFKDEQEQPANSDPAQLGGADGASDIQANGDARKKKKDKERHSLSNEKKDEAASADADADADAMPNVSEVKIKKKKKEKDGAEDAKVDANATTDTSDGKKKKKKKKKKDRLESVMVDADATPDTLESKTKKTKRDKKKNEEANSAVQGSYSKQGDEKKTKVEQNNVAPERTSVKKRKRESEARVESAKSSHAANEGFLISEDLSDNVKAQGTEQRSKKKMKKKSQADLSSAQHHVAEPDSHGQLEDSAKPKAKKPRNKKVDVVSQADTTMVPSPVRMPQKTPVPFPQKTPVPFPQKTPVPFPQTPQMSAWNARRNLQRGTSPDKVQDSAVLVPETPPSKATKQAAVISRTPVPLPQIAKSGIATSDHRPLKKQRNVICLTTPSLNADFYTSATAPAVLAKPHATAKLPTVPNALTDANLRSFKEPLNDESKPRPGTKRGASTTTSVPESSAASMNIQEAFARVGKPYVRSGAENDPFVTRGANIKKTRESHKEAPADVFNERFHELRKTVNFTEEKSYLEEYLEWDMRNNVGLVPCLKDVTGCTPRKEQILRLSKEENMSILSHLETEGGDPEALAEAGEQARHAEDLLLLTPIAHVPVPVGRLEGTWTLYCPRYAEVHFDKYGYGKRTLVISSIAGFKHQNSYTARLQLPPRTMSYTILAFQTPPHASFRATTVKTAAEGYDMDIIFMGNGYMQLRVDLRLLLTGKPAKEVEGREIKMEFIGVHEKAT